MKYSLVRWLVFGLMVTLVLAMPVLGAEQKSIALLAVNNYSGVDSVGGNKLARLVDAELTKAFKKQNRIRFIDQEPTADMLKQAGLDSYFDAATLCTNQDLNKIASRIGVDQLAVLDINGYSEVKREKSKKSYQLLLGLRVVGKDGDELSFTGEGFSEGDKDGAFTNAIANLINDYFNLGNNDSNHGNVRSATASVIGNKTSKSYHLLNTHHQPAAANAENFASRTEAEQHGYKSCPICFPNYKNFDYADRALEEELGAEGCGTIEYYYRVEQNPVLMARLERVAAPLFNISYRKNVDFRFRILDSNEVNAFSAPNGYLYFTKGIMNVIESDAELGFVIAHEMGHIEKKHAIISYRRAVAASIIASIFIAANNNNNNNQAANLLAVVMAQAILRGYSRDMEDEADAVAVAHLKQANMDYQAYTTVMGKFIDMRQAKLSAINKLFATHPAPEKRIEHLDKLVQSYNTLQSKLAQ